MCISLIFNALNAQVNCNQGDQNLPNNINHPRNALDSLGTSAGISADPNEIIGPVGYDSVRWVSVNDFLNYTIFFENDPDFATANAQNVDVRFGFEDKSLMKGFGISSYGFANRFWNVKDFPIAYQTRLDLRDSMSIYVDLYAGIDVVRQEAFWSFKTIDPATGMNPWQVDKGMLPVNDSTHIGEGFVKFLLRPGKHLKTGDTISIKANIVFDKNDTIATNRWCNRIDAGMPVSKVIGSVDKENKSLYHLTFEAKDDKDGSGLKRVHLYLANNMGLYEEYAACSPDTVLSFPIESGRQYQLYSIAEDNVGNKEPLKDKPELVINLNAAPTDLILSDSIFSDDLVPEGFVGELSSVDTEEEQTFVYDMAEGDGAIHNDLFQVRGSQLQIKNSFKCAEDSVFKIRLKTTDGGGMSYSKPFVIKLLHVLEKPKNDTIQATICEGDVYDFHGRQCEKAGWYNYTKSNDYMCDSVYVLNLNVLPHPAVPIVTVEGSHTLVSSAAKGNQWYKDGVAIEGATSQKYTPTEDGRYSVVISNGYCDSDFSQEFDVSLSDRIDLTMNLVKGWNWISSNLSDEKWTNAVDFLKPIEGNMSRLVGIDKELIKDPQYGLVGPLTEMSALESYKIQMDNAVTNTWAGKAFAPEKSPITLYKGWNWLGYLPVKENTLDESLSLLEASENDMIKSHTEFSVFTSGKWVGSLKSLKPGEGYVYYANSKKNFCYPATRAFPVEEDAIDNNLKTSTANSSWEVNSADYPDNMTIIGQVLVNDVPMYEGAYEIGAFVGKECRGIGEYVEGKLFLTVHGDVKNNESIKFKALENISGSIYDVKETLSFGNLHIGSFNNPFQLHVEGNPTGICNASGKLVIYPNPIRERMYINGETSDISSIIILSSGGKVELSTDRYSDEGIDVNDLIPGVYVVAIRTSHGVQYEKVVKVIK